MIFKDENIKSSKICNHIKNFVLIKILDLSKNNIIKKDANLGTFY